jgi:group I intron endonuclease
MVINAIITGADLGLELLTFFNLFEIYSSDVFLLSSIVPAGACGNADTMKQDIIKDNNKKAGIYLWTHKESGKRYVGSASNLKTRLSLYFNLNYLERNKTMHICNALKEHGYSTFSLSIIEYINITDLSLGEAKILILEREQFYIDSMKPEYNILPTAGSRLGSFHLAETLAKMSESHKGKVLSAETKALMSEAKSGKNHFNFGKTISAETKALLSKALSGDNHRMFGKLHSAETVAKISAARGGGIIFVYDSKGSLHNTFTSAREAGIYFNCTHSTILKYCRNGLMFKGQWILSTSLISK